MTNDSILRGMLATKDMKNKLSKSGGVTGYLAATKLTIWNGLGASESSVCGVGQADYGPAASPWRP